MNKLFSELNGTQPQPQPQPPSQGVNPIKRLMNMAKFASNPNQMIADAINSNPAAAQMFSMVKQSGKSPKDLFYELAKQKGVNPDDILKQLR